MRVPPPFALTLAPVPWGPRVYPVVAGAAAAVASVWALVMFASDAMLMAARLPVMAAGAAVLALAAGCCIAWLRAPAEPFWLAWDGNRWALGARIKGANATATCGALDVMIDMNDWLLLRFRPDDAPPWVIWRRRWLLARLPASGQAAALRATLYVHRRSEEPIAARWPV